jgi:Mlc titration factor MtfA (ptsG expression regulator)
MDNIILVLVIIAALILLFSFTLKNKKPLIILHALPDSYRSVLTEQVEFYKKLNAEQQEEFEQRMQQFLATTKITGVKTTVEDIDKILIAASAIIPIFSFKSWEYVNLHEVLLYPDSFNHDFEQEGHERNVLGMVGNGAFNHVMILSQHELRQAFLNKTGKTNTAIHEFVHLVDKTDGTVDGVPEFILQRQYILPWLQLMHKEIQNIYANRSDINPYGATNEAEFFAVVSEYFFERPDLFAEKHPELFDLLSRIFAKQTPAITGG